MSEATEIRKGLVGVVADTTAISKVNPDTNSLLYRGYPVQELAADCSFEEVAYLLWHGELPTPEELAVVEEEGRSQRELADHVRAVVDLTRTTAPPMDVLRSAVSVIGASDPGADDRATDYAKAVRLLSQIPAVIAYDQRRRRGQDLVQPRPDRSPAPCAGSSRGSRTRCRERPMTPTRCVLQDCWTSTPTFSTSATRDISEWA